jgi:hypothetical protein
LLIDEEIICLIPVVLSVFRQHLADALGKLPFTLTQVLLLMALHGDGARPYTIAELSKAIGTDRVTLYESLQSLRQHDAVTFVYGKQRKAFYRLSAYGREVAPKCVQAYRAAEDRWLSQFGEDDRSFFKSTLLALFEGNQRRYVQNEVNAIVADSKTVSPSRPVPANQNGSEAEMMHWVRVVLSYGFIKHNLVVAGRVVGSVTEQKDAGKVIAEAITHPTNAEPVKISANSVEILKEFIEDEVRDWLAHLPDAINAPQRPTDHPDLFAEAT